MFFSKWLPSLLDWVLSIFILLTALVILLVYIFQERLIYMPNFPPGSRTTVWTPARFGMPTYTKVALSSPDSTHTTAFYIPFQHAKSASAKRVFVVFCHANAGNVGHRLPIVRWCREVLWERCGVDAAFLMPSYRGYGESEGRPDEAGIRLDVQAGLDWLIENHLQKEHSSVPIFCYGQSIGGAVAIDLVSRNKSRFRGLIVENTFTSLPDLIPHVLPLFKHLTFLCRQRWPSKDRIAQIDDRVRVLIVSGEVDQLIPPSHSQRLYELAKKADLGVQLVRVEGGGHNDTVLKRGYFEAVCDFIAANASE
jgi:pimeloyl-ACP methyl ester carboxylesterase